MGRDLWCNSMISPLLLAVFSDDGGCERSVGI